MHYGCKESLGHQALSAARRFLARWRDAWTDRWREDLIQDSACQAWRGVDRVRDRGRFGAVVRTIARRARYQAWSRHTLDGRLVPVGAGDRPAPGERALDDECLLLVGEAAVPRSWLRERLDLAMAGISSLNRCLLRSYYEGFSCHELADRYGIGVQCVKVRLHRSRQRVRETFERLVRAAGPELEP